jgi:acyl-coenzyme A thioesterase PaaI-like protein
MQREYSRAGRARMVLEPDPQLGNVIGAVNGSVALTLLDVAMASAAVSIVDFARTVVTLSLDTSFLEPGRGHLTADGEVVTVDLRVDFMHATRGRLVASGKAVGDWIQAETFIARPEAKVAAARERQKKNPQ